LFFGQSCIHISEFIRLVGSDLENKVVKVFPKLAIWKVHVEVVGVLVNVEEHTSVISFVQAAISVSI
jgi:hypothetical protein